MQGALCGQVHGDNAFYALHDAADGEEVLSEPVFSALSRLCPMSRSVCDLDGTSGGEP